MIIESYSSINIPKKTEFLSSGMQPSLLQFFLLPVSCFYLTQASSHTMVNCVIISWKESAGLGEGGKQTTTCKIQTNLANSNKVKFFVFSVKYLCIIDPLTHADAVRINNRSNYCMSHFFIYTVSIFHFSLFLTRLYNTLHRPYHIPLMIRVK